MYDANAPIRGVMQRAVARRRILEAPDHAELLTRTVHMRFLPLHMEQGRLAEICSSCGEYHRVRICGNSHNHAWIYGFVEFATPESAHALLRQSGMELGHNGRNMLRLKCTLAKQPIVDRIFHDADLLRGIPCMFGRGPHERRSLKDAIESYLSMLQRHTPPVKTPSSPGAQPSLAPMTPMQELPVTLDTAAEDIAQVMVKAATVVAIGGSSDESVRPLFAALEHILWQLDEGRHSEGTSNASITSTLSDCDMSIERRLSVHCIAIALCAACGLRQRVVPFLHGMLDNVPRCSPTGSSTTNSLSHAPPTASDGSDSDDAVLRDVAKEVHRMQQQETDGPKRERQFHRAVATTLVTAALAVETLHPLFARCFVMMARARLQDALGERLPALEECCRGVPPREAFRDRWAMPFAKWFFVSYRSTAGVPPMHVDLQWI